MPGTQAPAFRGSQGENIDYTPASAVYAGDVVFQGSMCGIATQDIAANALGSLAIFGVFRIPKVTGAVTVGSVISWNPTGDPVTGTAGTGAANASGAGKPMGVAVIAAASGDEFVQVRLNTPGIAPVQTVAAAGSTNADAGAITSNGPTNVILVTAADATKGAILPAATAGTIFVVKNRDSENAILKIYPPSGAQINALTATTGALSMAAKTCAVFAFTSATQVYTAPLLPS